MASREPPTQPPTAPQTCLPPLSRGTELAGASLTEQGLPPPEAGAPISAELVNAHCRNGLSTFGGSR